MAKTSFLKEFRAFIERGSAIDMAVGIIVGAVMTGVVNSLVTDEEIKIKISDRKNPFYSKALNEMISIKGEKYKIIKISNP